MFKNVFNHISFLLKTYVFQKRYAVFLKRFQIGNTRFETDIKRFKIYV